MAQAPEPSATPRTPFIATAPARAALVPLEHGLGARGPFVLLTGDPGTGRSMLAREALRRRGDRIVAIALADPAPAPSELLASLLVAFGGGPPKPGAMAFALTERLMDTLANVTAAGRVAVALIDDAERLTDEHLLELHRITDLAAKRQCPFELLLVGTPKLPDRFDAPHMATVRPRISVRATLGRFSPNDTREYLQSRLNASGVPCTGMFSRKASRDIHQITVGTVRLVEMLAAESLRRATRAGQGTVSPEHVRAADHALRTGRPSEAATTPMASQVRAADVGTAANTRSVHVAPAPTHAPTQGTQPMGDQARRVASHDSTPSANAAPPQSSTPPQAAQKKPFRPGKSGGHPNAAHVQRNANPASGNSPAAPHANASPSNPAAPRTHAASSNPPAAQADPVTTAGTPAPAQSNANAVSSNPLSAPVAPTATSHTPAPAHGNATPSGTHARPAAKPARDPGSIGDYPSSDDPRVQEWLARFGGKGVRVGGSYPTASSPQDYADFGSNRMADADGVVTPARPIRKSPEAGVSQTPATPPAPHAQAANAHHATSPAGSDTPPQPAAPEPERTPAAQAPAAPASAPATREPQPAPVAQSPAAPSQPPASKPSAPASANGGKHAKRQREQAPAPKPSTPEPALATPAVARIERHVPGKRGAKPATRSAAPQAHGSSAARPGNNPSMLLVAGVILAAVAAIGVSQRHTLQSMFSQAFTETASHKAVTTVATPAPAPEPPPAPPAQYGIAVGSYPTRDMANAECEYLSRLVPVRVRVNALGGERGYRLLLGRFDDSASAGLASKRMQDQGLIPDARVIELAPLPASVSPVDTLASAQPESTSRESTVRESTVRDTPRSTKRARRRSR